MKKFVALLLVAILTLGLAATAFAAYPSVSLPSKYRNQSVKRGNTIGWTFTLKSGSYGGKRVNGTDYYRAATVLGATKGSTIYAAKEVRFSGTHTYRWRFTVPKTAPKGNWTVRFVTYYRPTFSTTYFTKIKTNSAKFIVK